MLISRRMVSLNRLLQSSSIRDLNFLDNNKNQTLNGFATNSLKGTKPRFALLRCFRSSTKQTKMGLLVLALSSSLEWLHLHKMFFSAHISLLREQLICLCSVQLLTLQSLWKDLAWVRQKMEVSLVSKSCQMKLTLWLKSLLWRTLRLNGLMWTSHRTKLSWVCTDVLKETLS